MKPNWKWGKQAVTTLLFKVDVRKQIQYLNANIPRIYTQVQTSFLSFYEKKNCFESPNMVKRIDQEEINVNTYDATLIQIFMQP